jgi:hypothetical protein
MRVLAAFTLLLAACGRTPQQPFIQRGVNFTAERGVFYGAPDSLAMMERLPEFGVNAVALVPFGFMRPGDREVRYSPKKSWERDDGIKALAKRARELGIKVMLKPHIWVPRSYPAAIDIPDPAARADWFASYGKFLDHYAALARDIDADLFCVGVELAKFTADEKEWRGLIRRVRGIYSGPLVYASTHGDEFTAIRFWDDLDYIGVNNYHPLDGKYSEWVARVEQVQRQYRRPVLFPEAGFSSFPNGRREPWAEGPRRDPVVDLDEQAAAYDAMMRAFAGKPWLSGVYWWKVGTNGFGGPGDASHTPWNKPAMRVLQRWFLAGFPPAPLPPGSAPSTSP